MQSFINDTKARVQLSPHPACKHLSFLAREAPLSHSLTHLSFGADFYQIVDNPPPNLKQFKLSSQLKHAVDHLPQQTTHVTIGVILITLSGEFVDGALPPRHPSLLHSLPHRYFEGFQPFVDTFPPLSTTALLPATTQPSS